MNTALDIIIFSPSGTEIMSAPVTSACEIYEELMGDNYVQLDWDSNEGTVLPAGSFIQVQNVNYTLLEEYVPDQTSENSWHYSPQFQHPIMLWSKIPFFMYTTTGGTSTKEIDWVLTAGLSTFLDRVQVALQNETGINWTVSGSSSESKTITFSGVDILSAINMICDAFGVEWCARWGTKNLYFATHIQRDSAANLTTGVNIGPQKVVSDNKEYYNRFYVFGSTRNIAKDYRGASVSNIANKRLTLNPQTYSGGYIQRPGTASEPVMSKILIFDDIYPAATDLTINEPMVVLMYTVDSSQINNEHKGRIVIGTKQATEVQKDEDGNPVIDPETGKPVMIPVVDEDGNPVMVPVYDTYPIWFFKLKAGANDYTFNKDLIIPGLPLSVRFLSGSLNGREFELVYHDTAYTVQQANTDLPVTIPAGYFEIVFKKEGDLVIPSESSLNPGQGNRVVLFNITMPGEYMNDAYERLESAALAEIGKYYSVNQSQYEADSYPSEFAKADFGLYPGRKVSFNGVSTRVLAITTRLDSLKEAHKGYEDVEGTRTLVTYPEGRPIHQRIKVGDTVIKGAIKELKDDAVNANQNIDVQAILQDTTKNLADAFNRSYSILLHNLDAQVNMWLVQPDKSVKLNPEFIGVWAEGFGAFGGKAGDGGDTPGGGGSSFEYVYTWHDLESGMSEPADTNNAVFNAAAVWNVYHAIDTRIQQLIGAAPEALDTLEEIADRLADDSDAIAAINGVLEGKASQAAVTALEARVIALERAANIWLIQQDGSVKLNPTYIGVWAEGFGSFGGKTGASGGGEGGGIQFDYVYGVSDLGGTVVSDDTGVFNAAATNHIYDLVTGLQTTTTSLSSNVTALTTTVGGHTTEIAALQAAVAAIDWFTIETVNSRPTLKLNTKYDGLWADGFGAFGGKHTSPSGGSGSGFDYIYTRSDLGGAVVSDDTGVFNADATNYIYSLVTALQTTTNALSGNLASNYYTKTQIDSIVSQIDVSDQLANYLPLDGGTMNDGAMVTLKEESSLSESETVLAPGAIKLKDYSDNYSIELNATNPSISIIRGGYYTSYAYGYVSIKNSSGSPKTISFPDKSGTFALTSDLPTALSDLTDDVVSGHYLSLNGGAMNNKNLVGNMNAEYLGGYESAKYLPVTAYNHTDGTLVKIAPSTSNRSLLIKIEGRHHATFGLPILTYVQLYWTASSATFTHRYALRVGRTMGTITALVSGGYLCLWFKQTASYNAYRITVYSGSYSYNYINSVSNAAFPADATSVTEIAESYVGAGTYLPLAGGTMVGDILAGTDSTYNLGSLTAGWNDLYVWNISSPSDKSLKFMKSGVEIARINNLGFIPNLTFPDDGVSYSASLGRNSAPWRSLYVSDQIVLGTPQDTTIGSAALEWDATNKAWHLLGNFYADGFISAGGLGNDEEEAHSYLDHVDIDESRLTNGDLLTWNGSNWVRIPQSSVRPDLTDYALLSDLPTNLSELTDDIGVATQTWVNANYALKSDVTGYLPLTGGTMTGAITLPAPSGGAKANAALIWSANTRIGGTAAEDLGLYAGNSIYLRPGGSTTLGVVLSTSSFTYNGNDVWHTGNLVNPARTYNSYTGTAASVPYIKVSITNTSEWRASFLVNFYCRYTHRLLVISGVNSASTTGWSYPGASCLAYGGYSPKDSVDVVFGYDSDDELWFAIPGDTVGGYARLSVSDCASGRVLQEDVDFTAIRVTSYEGLATGNGAIQSTVSAIKPTTDVSRADVAYLKKAWEGDSDRTATGWYRIGQFNGTIKSAELTLGCTYSNIGNAYVKLLIRGNNSAQLQIIQLAASRVTGFNRVRCVPTGTQNTYYVDIHFANSAARNAWSLYYPNDGRAFTPADSLTLITDEVTSSIEHPISATSSSLPLLLDNGAGVSARAADESSVNLARITTANNIVIGDFASDIWVYGDTSFKALLGSSSGPFLQLDSTAMLTVRGVTSSSPSILLQRGSTSDNYIDWKISNSSGNLLFASGTTSLINRLYLNKDTLRPYDNAGLELGAAGHYWSSLYSNRVYLAAGVYLEYDSAHGGIHVVGGGLYSDSFLAAGGLAEEDESSSNDKLTDLLDVNIDPTALSAGDMIKWSGAQWVKISQSEIQPNPAVFATRDWVESQGYLVGSDLSGYVTSQQLNSALAGYVTTHNFQQTLDDYYSSSEVDDALDELEYNLGLRIDDKIDGMTLTGDVTGSGGDSVVTTIANGAVTNAKIANPYMTIAGEDVALGGTISVATLKTNLGVSEIEGYFVNGNARHAVALANSHTLWGQTFDGTQNVSGAMSNVGTITPGSNNSYTLGTSSRKWSNIYATAGNIASVTSTTVTTTNLAVETISPKGSGTCVYFDGGDVALINGYDLLLSSTSKIELGPAIFEYDSVNKMVHVYGTDGAVPIGFYSDGPGAFGGLTNSGGESGASSYLADLLDVNVSGASSGQYLMYNGAQWVPATVSGGGEPIDTSAFVQSIRFNSQLYLPNASGMVDLPSVSGGTEWFNIHVKYQGSSSDTKDLTKIWTVVENYDSKLLNDNNYRMVLLRWRRTQSGRTGWKAAMLSDPSSDNAISYYAWWPITGRMAEWWDNLGSNNSGQVFYDCISTAKKRNQPTHFKSTGTSHYRVAVAIYKYTGEGTYGWHRVSNIAGIDMRGTSSGGTDYRTMQFD